MNMDFTQPPPQVKTLAQAQKLINALWSLCAEIPKLRAEISTLKKRIVELEEKLHTNSNNSSTPPSRDRFKANCSGLIKMDTKVKRIK